MTEHPRLISIITKSIIRVLLELVASFFSLFFRPQRNQCFSISDEILLLPAVRLGQAIKSGKLTSEQVVKAYIKQIKLVDETINAVVEDHFDEALKRARDIDRALAAAKGNGKVEGGENNDDDYRSLVKGLDLEQPFVGVPFTVKETIALAGASFTAGVAARANRRATENNPAVDRLIRAGMIPLASTNTPCMNLWFDSYNLMHGRTKNPYDRSRIPGGSSGGEAALIASAGSIVGVGSDLAGSIRIPCNFCGIFGHKPTPMSVSSENSYPTCGGDRVMMRAIGPMVRYACDLKPMLKLMITDPEAKEKMRLDEYVDLHKIKLFYCDDMGDPLSSACHQDILSALNATVEHLVSKFEISASKLNLEEFRYGLAMWSAVGEGGQHYAPKHPDGFVPYDPFTELVKSLFGTSLFPLNAIVSGLVEKFGAKENSAKQKYLKKKAQQMREQFNAELGSNGVLIMPAHPEPAPHHHLTVFKFLNCSYTAVANALYAPITQCPLGMSREGLPIGVQLITTQYNDRLTLALAQELEQAFGGWIPPVKISYSSEH